MMFETLTRLMGRAWPLIAPPHRVRANISPLAAIPPKQRSAFSPTFVFVRIRAFSPRSDA
jgi:hypothetical protein